MAYKIAIASGKGGAGKTTISVGLFQLLNENGINTQLVDCDVEEPNDLIFFSEANKTGENEISQLIPEIDLQKCSFCRKCIEYCEFNAIVVIPPAKFAKVNASLCHSCGACLVACNDNAISEKPEPIGKVHFYEVNDRNSLIEGRLKIGSAMQTMLIKELKKEVSDKNEITIYDAPPGTSCPVVETISDTDYVILVSEPTPFGLHDFKLMVELIKQLEKPFGLIINKSGIGDQAMYEYINKKQITLLGEIPYNQQYAASYANGNLGNNIPLAIKDAFSEILFNIRQKVLQK